MSLEKTRQTSWILNGTEICSACSQLYLYEMECYCGDCDVALCVLCSRRVEPKRFLCASCETDSLGKKE